MTILKRLKQKKDNPGKEQFESDSSEQAKAEKG